jgi:hypothetical protein
VTHLLQNKGISINPLQPLQGSIEFILAGIFYLSSNAGQAIFGPGEGIKTCGADSINIFFDVSL